MTRFLHPKALKLRNFKGIAELDLTLDESLTLLAGVNGVGKTSVIQALLAAVTHAWQHIPPHDYPIFGFSESVLRTGTTGSELGLEFGVPNKTPIAVRFEVRERDLHLDEEQEVSLAWRFRTFQPPLPLLVYYEQNRVARSDSSEYTVSFSSKENRDSSLHTTVSSPREFRAWFFEKEADEGQEIRERQDLKYADPELVTVRHLLKTTGRVFGHSITKAAREQQTDAVSGERRSRHPL